MTNFILDEFGHIYIPKMQESWNNSFFLFILRAYLQEKYCKEWFSGVINAYSLISM